jgi:enoyl-CoA hydratase/carnithine racemase
MSGDEALRYGLVRVVTRSESVNTEAERLVRELMAKVAARLRTQQVWFAHAPLHAALERAEQETAAYRSEV